MSGVNPFGASGGARTDKSGSGSGSSTPTISLDKPDVSVARYIIAAIRGNGGLAEFPVFREDAVSFAELLEAEIPDDVRDMIEDLPDSVETASFEDFFGVDLSDNGVKYVGTPPLLNEGDKSEYSDLSDEEKEAYTDADIYTYGDESNGLKKYVVKPDWVEIDRSGELDDDVIYEASTIMNGYFYPEFVDMIEDVDGARISVGQGRGHNHKDEDGNTDEFSKRRHVAFAVENGKASLDKVLSALHNVGFVKDEEYDNYPDEDLTTERLVEIAEDSRDE